MPAVHVPELLAAFGEARIAEEDVEKIGGDGDGVVGFHELHSAICSAVLLEVRRAHHFVALSLAEAEALRATLHAMRPSARYSLITVTYLWLPRPQRP